MNRYVCLWIVFHIFFWQHIPKLVSWIFYALSDMVSDIPWTSTWSEVRILNLSCLFVCLFVEIYFGWNHAIICISAQDDCFLYYWMVRLFFFSLFRCIGFSVDENQNLSAYDFNGLYELITCSAAYLRCSISLNSSSNKHKERECLLL